MDTLSSNVEEKQPSLLVMREEEDFLNVSVHPFCWCVTCPFLHCGFCPFRTILFLDDTAITRRDVSLCGQREIYVPYSKVQSIDHSQCCYCWNVVDVHGGLGTIFPGVGCGDSTHKKCRSVAQQIQHRVQEYTIQEKEQAKQLKSMQQQTQVLNEKLNRLLNQHVTSGSLQYHHDLDSSLEVEGLRAPEKLTITERTGGA